MLSHDEALSLEIAESRGAAATTTTATLSSFQQTQQLSRVLRYPWAPWRVSLPRPRPAGQQCRGEAVLSMPGVSISTSATAAATVS